MVFVETHSHLNADAFNADRPAVLEKVFGSGVGKIVEIACAPGEWAQGEKLAAANPGCIVCAFGVHPEYVKKAPAASLQELETFLARPCAAALGEVGLDYWWESGTKEEQLSLLAAQLPLCAKFSKPAVFHARNGKQPAQNAYADLLALLAQRWTYRPAKKFRGVLHCFSGSWADARAGLDLGLLLGVNGTFTYKNNHDLRETIRKAGLDNIVFETDCPYLPPQSARGKRNDPSFIPEIAAAVAGYLAVSTAQAAEKTTGNAFELFGQF
ncbi:MAG TPA: TatD family hydrolase [Elusimicrobiales bacterium]|nr:TatD family hydrolase [Elusimicrobiales bacterium]